MFRWQVLLKWCCWFLPHWNLSPFSFMPHIYWFYPCLYSDQHSDLVNSSSCNGRVDMAGGEKPVWSSFEVVKARDSRSSYDLLGASEGFFLAVPLWIFLHFIPLFFFLALAFLMGCIGIYWILYCSPGMC